LRLAATQRPEFEKSGSEAYQSVNRFLRFDSAAPKDASLLDALAFAVLSGLDELIRSPGHRRLAEAFDSTVDLRTRFRRYQQHEVDVDTVDAHAEKRYDFRISEAQSAAAAEYLLADQGREVSYACYRYSATVGFIAKSSLVITAPRGTGGYCQFENRFKNREGATREATGVCYREGDWIYFLGQIRNATSLKVLAVRAMGNSPAPVLQGVLMSRGDSPLVGRVALKRLTVRLRDDELGERSERTDREFKSAAFINTIRPIIVNSIEFQLQEQLYYQPARRRHAIAIDQKDMVAEVGRLLKGKFFFRKGRTKGQQVFNPARHIHYPFNQAISVVER
jgi:hypothetical protein